MASASLRADTSGLERLLSIVAVELRALSAARHALIEAGCIFVMRVYDQVTAKTRRQQAARMAGLFHVSPELTSKETPVEGLKNLNGDVRSAQSAPTQDSFFLFLHSRTSVMTSERGRK